MQACRNDSDCVTHCSIAFSWPPKPMCVLYVSMESQGGQKQLTATSEVTCYQYIISQHKITHINILT